MKRTTKVTSLFLALAFAGCATVRTVDTRNELNIRAAVEEGDRITLTTKDYRYLELRVVSLSDVAIDGEDEGGESVIVPYEDIETLEVREPRPGRTAGAVVGGIVGGAIAVYVLAIAAVFVVIGGVSGL